jgi:multiple sugar transport system substrate-binding protein
MRSSLELASSLVAEGCIDMDVCGQIEGNYEPVIMRFLEGDVPMMICSGDTVSGTRKRESQSEAFTKNPFNYTFVPVPLTEDGGIFLDRPSLQFSVNKECENLDMTNEFMRFLVAETELSAMAEAKRLVTPTKDLSFDSVYAAFGNIPAERTISPEALGISDDTTIQLRGALFNKLNGTVTIDEVIAAYGTFKL